MRNLLFLLLLLFSAGLQAQLCEPDTSYSQPGIHPTDSTLPEAMINTPYKHVMTIIVPEKQDTNGIIILVDSIELYKTIGVPAWLYLQCIDTCIFRSADTGCAVLLGTPPDSVGNTTYHMGFITKAYLRFQFAPNNPFTQFDTVANFWTLTVKGATGNEAPANWSGLRVYMSPGNQLSLVEDSGSQDVKSISIFNMLGQKVHEQRMHGWGLDHKIDLNFCHPGVYLVVVSGRDGSQTKKIMVR